MKKIKEITKISNSGDEYHLLTFRDITTCISKVLNNNDIVAT